MSQEFTDLEAAVTKEDSVVQSAITLLTGLKTKLDAVANDPAAVRALAAAIGTQTEALATAIETNTPAEGE